MKITSIEIIFVYFLSIARSYEAFGPDTIIRALNSVKSYFTETCDSKWIPANIEGAVCHFVDSIYAFSKDNSALMT